MIQNNIKNKKNFRSGKVNVLLIVLAVVAVVVALYFFVFRKPAEEPAQPVPVATTDTTTAPDDTTTEPVDTTTTTPAENVELTEFDKERAVSFVKMAMFDVFPDQQVGEIFEAYFTNPKWDVVSEDGMIYVNFTGGCTWYNEPTTMLMRFQVDIPADRFQVTEISFGDYVVEDGTLFDNVLAEIYAEAPVVTEEAPTENN